MQITLKDKSAVCVWDTCCVLTCASRSTSSAGLMLIGFSTSMCSPAFAISTSIAFAAMSKDPARDCNIRLVSCQPENVTSVPGQNKKHLVSSSRHGCPYMVALTMHCRRNPNDHPFRLCCRLQHALMIFESLTTFPLFGIRSLLILLDAFL